MLVCHTGPHKGPILPFMGWESRLGCGLKSASSKAVLVVAAVAMTVSSGAQNTPSESHLQELTIRIRLLPMDIAKEA
jgi:hypothetical protein